MKPQPTPEMEAENAAYTWAKVCLREHVQECQEADYLSDRQWEEIAWTFERLKNAVERHNRLEAKRLGKSLTPDDGEVG